MREYCKHIDTVDVEHGVFIERINRFSARVRQDSRQIVVHMTNTGRLEDLLRYGVEILYCPVATGRTVGKLIGVMVDERAAVIDTKLQAKAFETAYKNGLISWLKGYRLVGSEYLVKGSRVDYVFVDRKGLKTFVELKSAVYLNSENGAMYPDTVSLRGRKHITLLTELAKNYGSKIVFVAAHPRAMFFTPCDAGDPVVRHLLLKAVHAGVEIHAVKLYMDGFGKIYWCGAKLPVKLTSSQQDR